MGYTHYWRGTVSAEKAKYVMKKMAEDVNKILEALKDTVAIGDGLGQGGPPTFTQEEISFNGVGTEAHETFYLSAEELSEKSFGFCKTAYKPYDIAVVASLIRLSFHTDGAINIKSDGGEEEWNDGMLLCKKIFGVADLPIYAKIVGA